MGALVDKIFCTDKVSKAEISKWFGASEEMINKVCESDDSILRVSDFGEFLEKIINKDVDSCTEKKELDFLNCFAENLLRYLTEEKTKEYAELLYWIADVMAGGIGNCETALAAVEKALGIIKELCGEESYECASYYNLIGGLHYALDDCAAAIVYCEKSIEILKNESPKYMDNTTIRNKIESELAVFCSDAAVVYLKNNMYQKGHEYIAEAETWLKGINPRDKLVTAKVYYTIGAFYEIMKNPAAAFKYMKKAFGIYRKLGMMRQLRITGVGGAMSIACSSMHKDIRAIYYGEITREARERILGTDSIESRQMQGNLGVMYALRNCRKKGWSLLEKSMHNIESLDKDDYLDGAYLCIGGAVGYFECRNSDKKKAIECLDRAAKMIEMTTDERPQDKQILYENLASRYYDAGQVEKAVKYQRILVEKRQADFKVCQEAEKKKLGRVVADTFAGLGQFYSSLGQNARAIEQYEEAFRFCSNVFGLNSDLTGSLCLTMSRLYMEVGDVDTAREKGEMAYEIAKKVYGKQSRITMMTEQYLNQMIRKPDDGETSSIIDKIMEFLFGKKD